MPVYGLFFALRIEARFFAAASHVDVDVIAFIHVHAAVGFFDPFGIAHAELTSRYGNREDPLTGRRAFHAGIDFGAEVGTAIRAAAGGRVLFAGYHSDFGNMVGIDHGNGLTTRYAHASKLFVRADAVVTPGEVIAAVGTSGRSTGPHLHSEVLRHGEHADPRRYLAGV